MQPRKDIVFSRKVFFRNSKQIPIREEYEVLKELGSGGYGRVYQARHKASGEIRAIKAISKDSLEDPKQFENEINILWEMDHPNIIKLHDVYESKNSVYLVQEICEGGELFHFIVKQKFLTEADTAQIMRQIFSAVAYCHANRICHRDLKPENFLLKKKDDISVVKLIDFGLSQKLKEGERMVIPNGTAFYIAPEIIEGSYTEACDNWSVGVVLYVMLSGSPPFFGKNSKEILQSVRKGTYSFNLKPFHNCSLEVKDLITKLLVKDPLKRYTAQQAYNHPWVQQQVDAESKNIKIDSKVLEDLSRFLESEGLKKAIALIIAQEIPETEVEEWRNIFIKLDRDGNGLLNRAEFGEGFGEILKRIPEKERAVINIDQLFDSLDMNRSGMIDYSEFIAAFMHNSVFKNEKYLRMAFQRIDENGDGKITSEELGNFFGKELLSSPGQSTMIQDIIKEADLNKDGVVSISSMTHVWDFIGEIGRLQ